MPLPVNTTLSLQGQARPGEGITTKPKRAMIVRLTEETLDALQKLSGSEAMEFEFGSSMGIHIGETFFPIRSTPLPNQVHELFIRTTTPTRPSGPLRLNANIVGRFNVDRSEDLSRVQKQLHERSVAEAQKKNERQIVVLGGPLPDLKTTANRTAAKTKKKAPVKSAVARVGLTATSGTTSRGASPFTGAASSQPVIQSVTAPAPPAQSTSAAVVLANTIANAPVIEDLTSLRGRLVHFLALGSQTSKDIINHLAGEKASQPNLQEIKSALDELAEQDPQPKNSSATRTWCLKLPSWLAVRPHTYPLYNDSQRLTAERVARTRLSGLGIKEGHPLWEHVKFRKSGGPTTSTTQAPAPKKGKTKAAPVEVKAKSEAVVPSSSQKSKAPIDSSTNARPNRAPTPLQNRAVPPPPPPTRPPAPPRAVTPIEKERGEVDPEREEGELSASASPPRSFGEPSGSNSRTMGPPARPGVAISRKLPGSRAPSTLPATGPNARPRAVPGTGNGTTNVPPKTGRDRDYHAQSDREGDRTRPSSSSQSTAGPSTTIAPPPVKKETVKKPERPSNTLNNVSIKQERAPSVLSNGKPEREIKHERTPSVKKLEREPVRDRVPGPSKQAESDRERGRAQELARDREREAERRQDTGRKKKRNKEISWTSDEYDSEEDERNTLKADLDRKRSMQANPVKKRPRLDESIPSRASGATSTKVKTEVDTDRESVKRERDSERQQRVRERERERDRDVGRDHERDKVKEKRDRDRQYDRERRDRERERERDVSPPRKVIKREPPSPIGHKRTGSTSVDQRVNGTPLASTTKNAISSSSTTSKREARPSGVNGTSTARDKEVAKRKERLNSEARRLKAQYTSSDEDEVDEPPPPRATKKSAPIPSTSRPRAPAPASSSMSSSSVSSAVTSPRNLPSDSRTLRSLYSSTYVKYIAAFQKIVSQKQKIERVLQRTSGVSNGRGSSESGDSEIGDLDGASDLDVMGPEELDVLTKEHKRLHDELENIKKAFSG